jgi:hypothetical protein
VEDDAVQGKGLQAANAMGITDGEVDAALCPLLPVANPSDAELQDARWFHRDWIRAAITGIPLSTN